MVCLALQRKYSEPFENLTEVWTIQKRELTNEVVDTCSNLVIACKNKFCDSLKCLHQIALQYCVWID